MTSIPRPKTRQRSYGRRDTMRCTMDGVPYPSAYAALDAVGRPDLAPFRAILRKLGVLAIRDAEGTTRVIELVDQLARHREVQRARGNRGASAARR